MAKQSLYYTYTLVSSALKVGFGFKNPALWPSTDFEAGFPNQL